jgi:hypothetical protein
VTYGAATNSVARMTRFRRVASVLLLLLLTAEVSTARADDVGPPVTDPAGDCMAGPCADLLSVTPGLALPYGGLTFRITGAGSWWDYGNPPLLELPQIWIWTKSPDSAPPDATITPFEARIVGGETFVVNVSDPARPDMYGATKTILMQVGEGGEDVPGFLTSLGGPFRWRAALPRSSTITMDPARPVDPNPLDIAPNSGSIEFKLPDGDADGLPDVADPCPAQAFRAHAPGWSLDAPRDGCPAPAAPFTARAFKKAAKEANRSLRALWRHHSRRVKAIGSKKIDLGLRIPTGRGRVNAAVSLAHPDGPRPPSIFGHRKCSAGRCAIRMKVVPEGVRAYRHKALILSFYFTTGKGHNRQTTGAVTRLRMPATNSEVAGAGPPPGKDR